MDVALQWRRKHISCLFPEILALIFEFLEVRDKGRVAQVCKTWRDAAYRRSVWRGVEAKLHVKRSCSSLFTSLSHRGIRKVHVLSLRRHLKEVVSSVPNISELNLSGCYSITDIALKQTFVQDFDGITVLNLSLCKQLTDDGVKRVANYLKNLEALDLSGCCHVADPSLYFVARGLRSLRSLNLRSCKHVSDQGVAFLAGAETKVERAAAAAAAADGGGGASPTDVGVQKLERLVLQDCQLITDLALQHVASGLHHLREINVSFCASVTDASMAHLARLPELEVVVMRHCDNVGDAGLAHLSRSRGPIAKLDVSFCERVHDQGLLHLAQGASRLRHLAVNACNITDEGVKKVVSQLQHLETLHVGQCSKITDEVLEYIGLNATRLLCIDLYGCTRITAAGLRHVSKLPSLTKLNRGLCAPE